MKSSYRPFLMLLVGCLMFLSSPSVLLVVVVVVVIVVAYVSGGWSIMEGVK